MLTVLLNPPNCLKLEDYRILSVHSAPVSPGSVAPCVVHKAKMRRSHNELQIHSFQQNCRGRVNFHAGLNFLTSFHFNFAGVQYERWRRRSSGFDDRERISYRGDLLRLRPALLTPGMRNPWRGSGRDSDEEAGQEEGWRSVRHLVKRELKIHGGVPGSGSLL